jgi:primosomal protein N' (replication factor Y)
VAVKRAQLLNIPVVLGSATPSLESYYNATVRKSYHLLDLPDRVAGLKFPAVEIIDLGEERRKRRGIHLLSLRLEQALKATLDAKGQAILLLNRRGYANYIACPDHRCGWLMSCEHCDATMVYHKDAHLPAGGLVRCHHCEAEQLMPAVCPVCGRKVTAFGLGTQRVEEELARKFPSLKFIRMDSDAMRSGKDYERSLDAFRRGEIDLLLGTQMIAKGLDFPNVRLVGVVSGDTSLHLPDFRAGERTFQLIAQVAGRAGRGDAGTPGVVIVQTFNPNDPAIVLASNHDYVGFAEREIALRKEVNLPPHTRMARIVVRNTDQVAGHAEITALVQQLEAANQQLGGAVRIRGPMACPIARIAGFHRQQVELIAPDAATMQRLLTAARNAKALRSDSRMAVDVDPVVLL